MERPKFRLSGPVLDSPRPLELASFYERLLGWPIAGSEGPEAGSSEDYGWAVLRSPDGQQKIEIQWEPRYVRPTWPAEEGEQRMMMHLDFGVVDLREGVAWAESAGATIADHQPQEHLRVMLDPDGHPFCLFRDSR